MVHAGRAIMLCNATLGIRTVRCDELKLTLGNLFLCYLIGIYS